MSQLESESTPTSVGSESTGPMTHQRWVICGLLFLATVIAYVDRGVIAYLKNTLESVIPGLNDVKYGIITAAFQTAYGIAMVVAGGLTDKLGTRKAFAIAIGMWSIAAMLPGAAFSILSFACAMFLLGLGEAANFPACIKTVAEWFPKRERTTATGIFNSGANVGNIVVPLVVPFLVSLVTWRGTFVVTGAFGLVWLVFWLIYYRKPEEHRGVSKAELALILSDPGGAEKVKSVPWSHVLPCKETWAFAIGKFLTDPIWWFYLFWIPGYLQSTFHLNLQQSRVPVMLAYSISIIGSVGGGFGLSPAMGAGSVSGQTGIFWGGSGGTTVGNTVTYGGFIPDPHSHGILSLANSNSDQSSCRCSGSKSPSPPPSAEPKSWGGGAWLGFGVGAFFTNANSPSDLGGPFDNFEINTPWATLGVQWGYNDQHRFIWNISVPRGPSLGAGIARYKTNTCVMP